MSSNNHPMVLLLGQSPERLQSMGEILEQEGYHVVATIDTRSDHMVDRQEEPQVLILDMSNDESFHLVQRIRSRGGEEVLDEVKKLMSKDRLKEGEDLLRTLQSKEELEGQLIGTSKQMDKVRRMIQQVANTDLSVLILGESGTGKELVAKAIQNLSGRRQSPFVKVNCAAIPHDLLEAELFGYERGAFTSAYASKPGRFEFAQNGTIFLDEIGEIPLGIQSKLLQVLEQKEFVRLGGRKNVRVDVRIIAATNADLRESLSEGVFRSDLFFRINEVTIDLPPLRERTEDISVLVDHFLRMYNSKYGHSYRSLRPETLQFMIGYDWPGNVRELENMVKKIVVFGDESIVHTTLNVPSHTMESYQGNVNTEGFSLKDASRKAAEQTERVLIRDALVKTNWNRTKAAKVLGISYRSLLYKIKAYEIKGGQAL